MADCCYPAAVPARRYYALLATATLIAAYGCQSAAIKANQQQLLQQQAQLDQLKQQIQALQNQHSVQSFTAPPSGACDRDLMIEAARKGGERFAAGDFTGALPYYTDAVTACSQSAHAHLNLGRTYEALDDRAEARVQYQLAAAATTDNDPATASQIKAALARFKP